MSSLLLSERPLVVLPSLVKRVGLTRAILLQQIHWLLQQPRCGRMIDGRKWVWGNYAEWRRLYFPFWSERTLQRHILRLEEEGYLLSAQHNVLNWDRTKYYRLNYDRLNAALPCAGCADWDEPAADDADRMEAGGGFEPYEPEAGGAPSDGWAAEDAGTASPRAASTRAGHRGRAAADASPDALLDASPNPLPADVRPTAAALAAPERRPVERRTAERVTADGATKEGGAERQAEGGAPAPKPPTPAAKPASAGVRAGAPQGDAPSAVVPARTSPQPPLAEQRPPMRRAAPAAPPDSRPPQDRGGLAHAAIFGHQFDPAALPPAVRTFWELHGRLPSTAQRQMIEAAQITDQALWRRCLCTWAARGYNPMRIDGPLEWYAAPDLMDARREQRTPPPPAPAPIGPITLDVSPEIAALLAGKV